MGHGRFQHIGLEKRGPQASPMQLLPPLMKTSRHRMRAGVMILMIFVLIGLKISTEQRTIYLDSLADPIDFAVRDSQLHILIPASHPDVDLCKTVLSAAVLNYSTPTILNWGRTFHDEQLPEGGARLAEILGTLNYLEALGPEKDDDLVLMIDSDDTWFQLRPEHLIQRYFDINDVANTRIHQQLGRAMAIEDISQSIVFSAQKSCLPHTADDIACYAVPESTLPRNIFGSDTDVLRPESSNPYQTVRPRSLSTSLIIGPVGAMRTLFHHAHQRASITRYQGSSRDLLAEIFGEQEYQREVMRQRHLSSNWLRMAKILEKIGLPRKSILDHHPTHKYIAVDGVSRQFGMGLDYEGQLSHPSQLAENDADWLIHNSSKAMAAISQAHKITRPHVLGSSLPNALLYSTPPFQNLKPTLPKYTSWRDVPLYTNLYSAAIPATVQRATKWTSMWWQPYMRDFLSAHTEGKRAPIAEVAGRRWFSSVRGKGGVSVEGMGWVGWEDMCGGHTVEMEVFGNISETQEKEEELYTIEDVQDGEVTWHVVEGSRR